VECTQCHLEILHKIKSMAEPLAINCQTCHPDHHAAQRELYMGVGGKDAVPKASPMFIARVSCEGCHIGHKSGEIEGITRVAEPAACMSCHGTSYAHIQDGWTQGMGNLINQLTPYIQLVATEVERAEHGGTTDIREAEKLHQRATHNIELVRYGKGAHNVEYADELVESARNNLDQALKLLGSVHRVPPLNKPISPAGGACLSCHFGIETHTNEFGGRTFQHGRHTTTAQLDCSVCHSSQPKGQPEHGKTTLTSTAACDGCHHRQAIDPTLTSLPPARKVTCQTCHTPDELPRQIVYQQKAFNHDLHATQRGIQCNSCHTPNVQQGFKADCISCHHDETKVQVVAKCGTCHPNQTAMFAGTGYNIPSLKLAAQVTCAACHQAETQKIGVATRNGCKLCHKAGDYAAIMGVWQTRAQSALSELKVTETKAAALLAALDVPEAQQLYQSAKKDIDFIRSDASLGVHNPELTDVLVMNARERLQKCLDLLSQAIQSK
ncbi:cytochrome c3 family protein, partial [Candidatus Poribacteria bacterium]|nr:cytochrome c3 family protein [Candidatus Poribacteria bacterium]